MSSILDILGDAMSVGDGNLERLYSPVPPREFFMSQYYCGMPENMIPAFWLEEAIDFIEGGYNELIITGSIGSFKTTWANMITLYKMYELFSYKSIHNYFNLPKVQDIYNIYFNVNLTQATRTGYNQFKNMIDESEWYSKTFPRDTKLNSLISFPSQPAFKFFAGSGDQHAIGMTVWSFILDEGDFFKKSGAVDESYTQVTSMYTELVDRRVSRFQNKEKDFSFSVLISSASFQSSFVEKRMAASLTDPTVKVVKAVNYLVQPEKFSGKKIVVFSGDTRVDPELISTSNDINMVMERINEKTRVNDTLEPIVAYRQLPEHLKTKFETPPIELATRFRNNVGKALQNFCGVYVAAEGKLFQSKSGLHGAYMDTLHHPFSKLKIELSTGDLIKLQEYFIPSLLRDVSKPHALHIDGSVTGDSTGFSMVRFDGMVDGMRHYTQVFSLEIIPPPAPYRIKLSKIREFIFYMVDTLNVNIIKVTQDTYQSEDALQLMADRGLHVDTQSIDKSDKPYLTWINLLYDGCMHMYDNPILESEAFAAIHNRKRSKVDHPPGADSPNINVLQSFVGALANLAITDEETLGSDNYDTSLLEHPTKSVKHAGANVLLPDVTTFSNVADLFEAANNKGKAKKFYGAILD